MGEHCRPRLRCFAPEWGTTIVWSRRIVASILEMLWSSVSGEMMRAPPALMDWGLAGWYPGYWEFVQALSTINTRESCLTGLSTFQPTQQEHGRLNGLWTAP